MFHRSERLLLRPPWAEDWENVLGGIADEGVVRNLASAPWPYSADDARDFVGLPIEEKFPRFLITRASDAALLGCVGIDPAEDGATEIGYWIARQYWGRGYATEAANAVIKVAHMLGHRRLRAGHFLDNPASGRVLTKVGFKPTGSITQRHSRGRGTSAPLAEFALDLDDVEAAPQMAA